MEEPFVSPRKGDLNGDSKDEEDESEERRTAVVDMAAAAVGATFAARAAADTAGRRECVSGAIPWFEGRKG